MADEKQRSRSKLYWVMNLVCVSSIQYGSIDSFWYMKTWFISKNFMKFSMLTVWAQNFLTPPGNFFIFLLWRIYILEMLEEIGAWRIDIVRNVIILRILLTSLDQNLLIIFVNNIHLGNIRTVWGIETWYSVKCHNTPYATDILRSKSFDYFCE